VLRGGWRRMPRRDKPRQRSETRPLARTLIVASRFLADLQYWLEHDWRVALRVVRIIREVARDPFLGIGKPEPLKHDLAGTWSRRINDEDRLIYTLDDAAIEFLSARYHYE
jgi:toxin YoeB